MIDKPDQDVSQYLVLLILVITVDRLFCLDQQDRGLQKIWDQDSGEKFLIQDSYQPFSHHYQGSIDFNTVGMYFLVFTGIEWHDLCTSLQVKSVAKWVSAAHEMHSPTM